eukprot:TRINITY_DN63575_c0_g1_i1.p1 TRINITY_DN63575_c0_g1~~TRINITY_DN63575_c0_g1_i1.p1  ORF type:complete len:516 (-),score=85.19 TRINITY_DN63575_c0_g1_i1:191-1738(-)
MIAGASALLLLGVANAFHMNEFLNITVGSPAPADLLKTSGKVRGKAGRFVDEDGRERLFHGVNAVMKGFPWLPQLHGFDPEMSLSEVDMEMLSNLGFNVIRLGLMWPGVEPEQGVVNQTYLREMQSLVDRLASYGIYAYLDGHQDLLSEKMCGEGFPLWAVNITPGTAAFPKRGSLDIVTSAFKLDENGVPEPGQCVSMQPGSAWTKYNTAAAVLDVYTQLYDPHSALQNAFVDHWKTVGKTFRTSKNLLGYDVLNEPQVSYLPDVLRPWKFESQQLQPLYDRLAGALRESDEDATIFFANLVASFAEVGYDHVPGGAEMVDRSVLTYHYYYPLGGPPSYYFSKRAADLKRLGAVGFVGEFGAGDNDTVDLADKYLQSWTVYQYKKFFPMTGWGMGFFPDKTGELDTTVPALSRTYASAVAGHIESMHFDRQTAKFELNFVPNEACRLPTEVYANKIIHYPNDFDVKIVPAEAATVTRAGMNRIHIHNSKPWLAEHPKAVVQVIVQRKGSEPLFV